MFFIATMWLTELRAMITHLSIEWMLCSPRDRLPKPRAEARGYRNIALLFLRRSMFFFATILLTEIASNDHSPFYRVDALLAKG
jgi:hypothetical protein